MRLRAFLLLFLSSAGLAFAASPRDGRWAIDAACVPIGCFPGDSAGFPVQIGYPGSYLLTSDLNVSGEPTPLNATAIEVQAPGVDLDLGGFTLLGPVSCSSDPPVCSPGQGDGVGVHALSGATGVRIHDGAIRGFGAYGVQVESRFSLVTDLRTAQMGWTPVYLLGIAGRVERIVATDSGGAGIYLDPAPASAVSESSVDNFTGSGIYTSSQAWIVGNAVNEQANGPSGIFAGDESLISGNTTRNGGTGIVVGRGALVDHNALDACALGTCPASDWGILLDLGSGYSGNVIFQSDNQWTAGGASLGQNLCYPGAC